MTNEVAASSAMQHVEPDDVSQAMRTEAAVRSRESNNWMMAALITTNGGAIFGLLGQPDRGVATAIALGLFAAGVTCALVAGRLAAVLAYEAEALFVSAIAMNRATRHLARAADSKDEKAWELANAHCTVREEAAKTASEDFAKTSTPDLALGLGVIFFVGGCIAAGVAIF